MSTCAAPVRCRRSARRRWRASPRRTGWRGSRATASWSRNARRRRCASARREVVLPPGAFLQATRRGRGGAGAAGRRACRRARRRVADLFCGVGPFALRLAERARVFAADGDAAAIAALQRGRANDLRPQAGRGRGARPVPAPAGAEELKRFDAVVFDPPRQGAEAQARAACRIEGARSSSRSHAMPRPSRATRASWSTAAIG